MDQETNKEVILNRMIDPFTELIFSAQQVHTKVNVNALIRILSQTDNTQNKTAGWCICMRFKSKANISMYITFTIG